MNEVVARWMRRAPGLLACALLLACGQQELGQPAEPPTWPLDNLVAKRPPRTPHGAKETSTPLGAPAIPGAPAAAPKEPDVQVEGLAASAWKTTCLPDATDCTVLAQIDGKDQQATIPRSGARCKVEGGKLACVPYQPPPKAEPAAGGAPAAPPGASPTGAPPEAKVPGTAAPTDLPPGDPPDDAQGTPAPDGP